MLPFGSYVAQLCHGETTSPTYAPTKTRPDGDTATLGQIDSAIGGKTAIDLPEGKNLVGAFHQPRAVVCDTTTLQTLPDHEFATGMAEAIKHALIAPGTLADRLTAQSDVITARDPAVQRIINRLWTKVKTGR